MIFQKFLSLNIIPEEIARRIISREKNKTDVDKSSNRTKIIPKNSVPTCRIKSPLYRAYLHQVHLVRPDLIGRFIFSV